MTLELISVIIRIIIGILLLIFIFRDFIITEYRYRRLMRRKKILLKLGYKEIPYGFEYTSKMYNYGFSKGDSIISALEIMTLSERDFRLKIKK